MNFWEKDYQNKGINAQRKYPNTDLISFVLSNFKEGNKVLEVGCGSGANIWFLAENGLEVYGIDFSDTGLKLCKEVLDSKKLEANLSKQDMTSLNFEDNFFDGVVDVVSIEVCNNIKKCYQEINRVLKPEGSFFSYTMQKGKEYYKFDYMTLLNKETATPILKEAGFNKVEFEEVHRINGNKVIEYLIIKAKK